MSYGIFSYQGVDYRTITIGAYEWMVDNFQATKYNDDTDIPYYAPVTPSDFISWSTMSTPGYCTYNNSAMDSYGGLYNYFCLNEKFAPPGWQIPSRQDWINLSNFVGGGPVIHESYDMYHTLAGGNLKETGLTHWNSPNTGATDSILFGAIPGGNVYTPGFSYRGNDGFWWSNTGSTTFDAMGCAYDSSLMYFNRYWPQNGLSIRFVRPVNPPVIITQPVNQAMVIGSSATFSVTASNVSRYQWQKNDIDIEGANNSSYTTPIIIPSDNGSTYRCIVSNSLAIVISNRAILGTGLATVIVVQPKSVTITGVKTTRLTIVANGISISYQWQKWNGSGWDPIGGNVSYVDVSISIPSITQIQCVVSGTYGTDTSDIAFVTDVNDASVMVDVIRGGVAAYGGIILTDAAGVPWLLKPNLDGTLSATRFPSNQVTFQVNPGRMKIREYPSSIMMKDGSGSNWRYQLNTSGIMISSRV